MSDNSLPEKQQTEECGNILRMDGMTRRCIKPKGHTGQHSDHPWLEGVPDEALLPSSPEKKLSEDYMQQLKKQLDVKLALTIKFMNSAPILEETIQKSPNELKKLSDAERQKIIITVENATNFAEVIAKEICPITAPMEAT